MMSHEQRLITKDHIALHTNSGTVGRSADLITTDTESLILQQQLSSYYQRAALYSPIQCSSLKLLLHTYTDLM